MQRNRYLRGCPARLPDIISTRGPSRGSNLEILLEEIHNDQNIKRYQKITGELPATMTQRLVILSLLQRGGSQMARDESFQKSR